MDKRLRIYLKTGHAIAGQAVLPMGRHDLDLEIVAEGERESHTYSLEEICYIRFAAAPPWFATATQVSHDEVQTITDDLFNVIFFEQSGCRKGMIGRFKLVFIAGSGN